MIPQPNTKTMRLSVLLSLAGFVAMGVGALLVLAIARM